MARNFVPTDAVGFADNAAYDVTSITIFVWVKSDLGDDGSDRFIFSWDDTTSARWGMRANTAGANNQYQMFFRNTAGGLIGGLGNVTTSGVDTSLHNLATSFDGTTVKMYFDGTEEDTTVDVETLTTITNTGYVGKHAAGAAASEAWDGVIAHFVVWSVELSASEIDALGTGVNPFVIRYLDQVLNCPIEGNDSPEPDYSLVGNNGVLEGTTKSLNEPPVELLSNYLN